MPLFSYKGRNSRGEMVQGSMDGASAGAVADHLFNSGVTPLEIIEGVPQAGGGLEELWGRLTAEPVTLVDLMLFSRQMHALLKAGVPILRALAGLQESARHRVLAELVQDLRVSLETGRELSVAMRRHPGVFSPFYVSMVRVGEMTGMLDQVFLRLADHLEFEKEMRDRIRAALRYPQFVVAAMAVAIVIINIFVIPAFAKVYAGFKAELPIMTRLLIGFSDFMVAAWPVLLIGAVGAVIAFRAYVATDNGRYQWDRLRLRLPVAGKIVLKATLARFTRSFALAYRSGVPAVQALSAVAQVVDNSYIAQRVEQMRDGVERGESLYRTAATSGVFTPTVLQMIAVGEETGELDTMMSEVADLYQREVEYEVRTLSEQIEPILIVGLGAVVLVFALGVFLPVWDLGRIAFGRG